MKFNIPTKNEKLRRLIQRIERDEEIEELLRCSNVTAIDRLGFTDHGPVHAKIVANVALKLARLLEGVEEPGIVRDHKLSKEESEIVVLLASVFHDVGMVVHRDQHEFFSGMIAYRIFERLLSDYPPKQKVAIISETLHAIASHHPGVQALTKEAGIFCIADALDMEKGRARIPFDAGKVDIHSVSALAIEKVELLKGKEKPVTVKIKMSNSAGIFQVDELLGERIRKSGLAKYIDVVAEVTGEVEKTILRRFEIR